MEQWLKVDFHCHSEYSLDCATRLPALIEKARHCGLDRLVITDHNTIRGALLAHKIAPDFIIIGEEIETQQGELLAIFVKEEIPKNLHINEVIHRLHTQNAFISASHPFDFQRMGLNQQQLTSLVYEIDAIEVFNARCITNRFNHQAMKFALENNLPGTAGSDAHSLLEIGRGYAILPLFRDTFELRCAIRHAKIGGKLSPYWVHFLSRFARFSKIIRRPT
jgi:predicted metal-dependent phosphoesterase TrpH